MKAGQLTIKSHPGVEQTNQDSSGASLGATVRRWLSKMVGCGHKELSRPFGNQGQSYRVCLACGAQRRFNSGRWEMQGDFYYSLPTSKHFRALNGLASVRRVAG
jgi:hypothetical protein